MCIRDRASDEWAKISTPKRHIILEPLNVLHIVQSLSLIHIYVKDPSLKAELKECSGIGTEATRAGIIDGLQKRGFLAIDKKNLVPTDKACMAIKFLPETITYPDTTAVWDCLLYTSRCV